MSIELSSYESLVRAYSCSWKIRINKYISKDQIENTILILTKEYSYLSSEFKEGSDILEYKENYHPPVHYYEKMLSNSEYWDKVKKVTSYKNNITSEYFIYADKSKDESEIIGIFNHAMVDGVCCIDLCNKFCLHLSNPSVVPKLHSYTSAQNQIKIPKDVKNMNFSYIQQNIPILTLPSYLHECNDCEELNYHVFTGLIENDDLKEILKYIHEVHCSFQGLLWITTLLSQMKMYKMNDFSKVIRFHTMATSKGRAEFDPPVLDDDISRGGFYSYVTKKINKEDKIVNVIVDLSKELHDELHKKQQMYDFFMSGSYSNCPSYSISCCTMGKRGNKKHYEGEFSFDVLSQNFLLTKNLCGDNCGMGLYCFTVDDIGCYICNSFLYPQFTDEEMKCYVENIIRMMKCCSKEENKNITIEDLMKM